MWAVPQPQHSVLPLLDKGWERRNGVPRMGLYPAPSVALACVPPPHGPWGSLGVRGRHSGVKASHTLLGRGAEGPCPDPVREACPGHHGALEDLWLLFL